MTCNFGLKVVSPVILVAVQSLAVTDASIAVAGSTHFGCRDIEAGLLAALADAPERIALRWPPTSVDGKACAEEETDDIDGMPKPEWETGKFGTADITVRSVGPAGSGHYWDVAISVKEGSATRGVCLVVATTGWRNIGGPYFPRWKVLENGTLTLWNSFETGGGLYYSLLFPAIYRLDGDSLVLDRPATLAEIRRFAVGYRRTAGDKRDREPSLHAAAAAAYLAVADGRTCGSRTGARTRTPFDAKPR
jgi:hypothetical protein